MSIMHLRHPRPSPAEARRVQVKARALRNKSRTHSLDLVSMPDTPHQCGETRTGSHLVAETGSSRARTVARPLSRVEDASSSTLGVSRLSFAQLDGLDDDSGDDDDFNHEEEEEEEEEEESNANTSDVSDEGIEDLMMSNTEVCLMLSW